MGLTRETIIAENIRRWRGYRLYTQDHVTEAMNRHGHQWTRSTIGKIENGTRQLTAPEFVDLAIVLGMPKPVIDWVMEGEE